MRKALQYLLILKNGLYSPQKIKPLGGVWAPPSQQEPQQAHLSPTVAQWLYIFCGE